MIENITIPAIKVCTNLNAYLHRFKLYSRFDITEDFELFDKHWKEFYELSVCMFLMV